MLKNELARSETRSGLIRSVVKITECETVSAANDLLRKGNYIIISIAFSGNFKEGVVTPTIIVGELPADSRLCTSFHR